MFVSTFLMVFIPFWLVGKCLILLGNWMQRWSREQLELRGISLEDEPRPKRRSDHLRLLP